MLLIEFKPLVQRSAAATSSASLASSSSTVLLEGGGNTIGKLKKAPTLEKHMEWYIDCEVSKREPRHE